MRDVVGDDREPPGQRGGPNEDILNVDSPPYGPEVGKHVAGHQSLFSSNAQDFDTLQDLPLDPAPEGTVIPASDGPMTQLHDTDTRGEQRVRRVLAELLEQVGSGRFPDELT